MLNIYEFLEIYRGPMSGLLLKIRASLLAEFSFINNITEIDHNFGAPAAGRFHRFFSLWVILWG